METNKAEWSKFCTELQECVKGTRGWVSCSIARSKVIGLAHANLKILPEALGLKVLKHGQYGWIASRV